MSDLPPFFESIIVPSCRAAVLILGLFLLRYCLGNRLSPTWRHALWGLVLLALLPLPMIPSPVSVYNLLPQREIIETNVPLKEPEILPESRRETFTAPVPSFRAEREISPSPKELEISTATVSVRFLTALRSVRNDGWWFLGVGWLLGCLAMTLVFLRQTLVCRFWTSGAEPVKSERIWTIFESCRRQMKTKTWLVVAESTAVSGPFLIGAIRPTLLLPHGMIESASEKELRTVFLHELAHLKRWDVWTGWLMTLLLIVHWFNPLLWLAIRRMNADREEACDALALETLNTADRRDYARSLLDITERYVVPDKFSLQTPGLVGISETGKFLTRRIDMIRQIGTWKLRWKIFAMVAVLCLGAATLTDAKEKKPKKSAADIQKKIDKLQTQLQKAKDAEHGAIYKPEKMPSQDDERFPKNFPSLKFIGDYSGMEGDRPIDFSLNIRAITADDPIFSRSTGKKFEVDRIEYTISKELFATVYRGGFSKDKKIQDDVYLGRLRYVNSNELELCVVKHFKDNADQKSIPDALKKLSVKVIRDGDKVVTLEIPKNDVWGEIHVTRTVREAKTLPSAPLQKAKDAEVEVGMISVQVSPDGKRQPYPLKQIVGKYSGKYKDSDLEMLVFDKNIAGYEVMIRMDDYIRGSGMAVLVDESGTPIVAGKPAHGLKVEYSTQENRSSVVRFNVTFKKENDDLTAEMKIENTGEIVALRKIVFEIPDWFLKRDKNGDGNLTLSEYADGKPVTESMIREFEGLDADRDGVVTTAEVQKFLDLVEKYKQEQKSVPLQEPTVKPDVVKDKLDPKTEKKMPQPGELRAVEMKIDPTPLADSDVLVFDGQWKNEKTGADIAAGTVFKGSKGMFRLTVENGLGKVLLLDGSGATGEGKYVRLSDGGQAIGTSMLPRKEILEAQAEEYARLLKNTAIVQAYAMTDLTHTDGIIAELQKRLADSPDVRISKDVKTNMLLVVGDKTDHEKVKEFLAEVRKEQAEIRKSMKDEASESAAVRVAAGAFPGQYLGTEGKHRIGIEIGDGNTRPITIYENGLPGNGYDILKDKKYVGTLQLNANLISGKMWSPITLKQKFVGSREEPLEPELRELKMAIELKAENNDIVLVLSIPKNKIWDEVRVTKTLKEKSSPQHGELRSVETKIDPTPLADSDVLVFDGQWKNEKTGADIAAGTVFKGSKGMFRLTVENGLGKVLRLDGFGASGEGKYICLSNGGQAIETSILSRKVLSAVKAEVEELATKSLAGRYLGREGDDKMGMVLAPSTKTVGDYDVTVYEDGLPDDGHDPNDDDRYEGTATFKDGMLEIRLAKKFDEGREEPVEKPLQHLTATIGIDTEGNVKIDIPRNAEWDAVRLEKRK